MIDGEAPGETTCQQRSSSCAVDFLTGKSTTDGDAGASTDLEPNDVSVKDYSGVWEKTMLEFFFYRVQRRIFVGVMIQNRACRVSIHSSVAEKTLREENQKKGKRFGRSLRGEHESHRLRKAWLQGMSRLPCMEAFGN
ncbi:putative protein [Arabidopsis thaliana]|uniref:Uncharacterized protein F7K15_140 n=1 Tax=Arabidopsis thaliana TaxID=3702 RepID=Q9LXK5_ARATH|nr:uncharacterized protein AT3G43290 [Arabidopsis thaliana]AEE77783.1 hypothetical protein AT3G43290 [Arabidopsis thaliana]CAB89050.1 putative protein [Arabidopsis thaliana]|eukprot:NP_189915.1 hypothetical protein AT3G43290 [Arabidopsis thaliana]